MEWGYARSREDIEQDPGVGLGTWTMDQKAWFSIGLERYPRFSVGSVQVEPEASPRDLIIALQSFQQHLEKHKVYVVGGNFEDSAIRKVSYGNVVDETPLQRAFNTWPPTAQSEPLHGRAAKDLDGSFSGPDDLDACG